MFKGSKETFIVSDNADDLQLPFIRDGFVAFSTQVKNCRTDFQVTATKHGKYTTKAMSMPQNGRMPGRYPLPTRPSSKLRNHISESTILTSCVFLTQQKVKTTVLHVVTQENQKRKKVESNCEKLITSGGLQSREELFSFPTANLQAGLLIRFLQRKRNMGSLFQRSSNFLNGKIR